MERERKNNATSGGSLVVFFRCPSNIPSLLGVEYFTGELSIKCALVSHPWKCEICSLIKKILESSFLEFISVSTFCGEFTISS